MALIFVESGVQKSMVIPHWPNMLQHAFKGHGFKPGRVDMLDGVSVPLTCGPQTAFGSVAGIGGEPGPRHMMLPTARLSHPDPEGSLATEAGPDIGGRTSPSLAVVVFYLLQSGVLGSRNGRASIILLDGVYHAGAVRRWLSWEDRLPYSQ
jgi:hypothetical protein